MNKIRAGLVLVLLLVAAAGVWFMWLQPEPSAPPPPVPRPAPVAPVVVTPVVPEPPPAPMPPQPVEPVIQHPVQAIETPPPKAARPLPRLDGSDARLKDELNTWLGRKKVQQFLQLDNFVRRVVVTVDNLARDHAAPAMWPVHVMPGRFSTLRQSDGEVINPDNAQRYASLVQFIDVVDARAGVQIYASLYPLFQQAYEELGYPKAYFNDRLVAVIDKLLATPVHDAPLAVTLVQVKGPIASERPWTRYEFEDDDLQSLTSGQKMLLRTGAANHRRLRTKLLEIRQLVTKAALPASAAKKK